MIHRSVPYIRFSILATEEPIVPVEDKPQGGDGNPDTVDDVQRKEAAEEAIVAVNEVPLGGNGNEDVVKPSEENNN